MNQVTSLFFLNWYVFVKQITNNYTNACICCGVAVIRRNWRCSGEQSAKSWSSKFSRLRLRAVLLGFLPGFKLWNNAFLFAAIRPLPNCDFKEIWRASSPRDCFPRSLRDCFKFFPSITSCPTLTAACNDFLPSMSAPFWRWGTAQRKRPLNVEPNPQPCWNRAPWKYVDFHLSCGLI